MPLLNLPPFDVKLTHNEGKRMIFDSLRKKYVVLTPEEWVRQHFINYLITEKNYPLNLLGNEINLRLNATLKRCDSIVYNSFLVPLMIIEYKAPTVPIKRIVFDQISRYNAVLRVPFLTVSNGIVHYCCMINYDTKAYSFLDNIPSYDELDNIRL
ncbi:MAG: type I restriction enzyme HsdR N-terminal domain-containing protein [Tannerellaceae bacterium]|nr:type I restriction enzyme HsdR N-terminal domain-containing protein [Tannerellaceae bacterium]